MNQETISYFNQREKVFERGIIDKENERDELIKKEDLKEFKNQKEEIIQQTKKAEISQLILTKSVDEIREVQLINRDFLELMKERIKKTYEELSKVKEKSELERYVLFLGVVEWTQITGDTSEKYWSKMNAACKRKYGDTARAATASEYNNHKIKNLPQKKYEKCVTFTGSESILRIYKTVVTLFGTKTLKPAIWYACNSGNRLCVAVKEI